MPRTFRFASVAALLCGLVSPPARGGEKVTYPVTINVYAWGTYVNGNPGDARASSNRYERIGCAVNSYADGFVRGLCQATDKNNRTVSCYVTRPEMIQTIYAIGPATYMGFNFDAGSSDCANIVIENGSRFRPVTP